MQEEKLSRIGVQISNIMQMWYANHTIFIKIMELPHKLYFAQTQMFEVKGRESNSQFQVVHMVWEEKLQPLLPHLLFFLNFQHLAFSTSPAISALLSLLSPNPSARKAPISGFQLNASLCIHAAQSTSPAYPSPSAVREVRFHTPVHMQEKAFQL